MQNKLEPYEALYNRAIAYLARRDYGTHELREKLLRPQANCAPPDEVGVETVLMRLTELGLLSDERRAEQLTASLLRKGYGPNRIQMELRQRDLPEAQGFQDASEDTDAIKHLLRAKYAARLQDERGRRAVFQALLRRGFRCDDIKSALKDYATELDEWEFEC